MLEESIYISDDDFARKVIVKKNILKSQYFQWIDSRFKQLGVIRLHGSTSISITRVFVTVVHGVSNDIFVCPEQRLQHKTKDDGYKKNKTMILHYLMSLASYHF